MNDTTARVANLLGAAGLAVADAEVAAIERVVGRRGGSASALVTLAACPGWTATQLQHALGLSQPGVARLVDRLADAGWLERDTVQGRRRPLRLTTAGRQVVDDLLDARRTALSALLDPLDADERAQLGGLLERLLGAWTTTPGDVEPLCRLCERAVCDRCPVALSAAAGGSSTAIGDGS